MFNIPCVIFAGGKSSRMGEDKALLPFANFPTLTEYQLNRLTKIFPSVYISCKTKKKFTFQANFIEDLHQELYAPTTAFISVFEKLQCEKFFALSVDTPFISEEIIQTLIDNDDILHDATVAILNGKLQPLCGIYHRSLLASFQKMQDTDNHKLNYLLKNSHLHSVEFSDHDSFLNLNTPNEYNQALSVLKDKEHV